MIEKNVFSFTSFLEQLLYSEFLTPFIIIAMTVINIKFIK